MGENDTETPLIEIQRKHECAPKQTAQTQTEDNATSGGVPRCLYPDDAIPSKESESSSDNDPSISSYLSIKTWRL